MLGGVRHKKGKEMTQDKHFLITLSLGGYYNWCVYEIYSGGEFSHLVAEPIGSTGAVTRCADTLDQLKILLQNDVIRINKFKQKVR